MKKIFIAISLLAVLLSPSFLFADETEISVPPEMDIKLQQVVESQQQILQQLVEIKEELRILKVRVSQNQ